MNLCCVVIPIYKQKPSEIEIVSLRQCLKTLGKYPVVFVTHKELDATAYEECCRQYNIAFSCEYFSPVYFFDINGYNALMLSKKFYVRFSSYEYMLIYQLDAYVFRDELEYWCRQEYDYIGAPWLESDTSITPKFRKVNPVGNGGFSLRKIKKIITCDDPNIKRVYFFYRFQVYYNRLASISEMNRIYLLPRFILRPFLKLFKRLYFPAESSVNEDELWATILQRQNNIPKPEIAMKFSFEYYPEHLFMLNDSKLPFGCHAWYKYYNYLFFKQFITIQDVTDNDT